jgi:hypothetical protein
LSDNWRRRECRLCTDYNCLKARRARAVEVVFGVVIASHVAAGPRTRLARGSNRAGGKKQEAGEKGSTKEKISPSRLLQRHLVDDRGRGGKSERSSGTSD